MFEVLVDENLPTEKQLVLDKGQLDVPEADKQNNGKVNFGAGSRYLVTYFEKFNQAKAYTLCGPGQYISRRGDTECFDAPKGEFTLDPFAGPHVGVGISTFNCKQRLAQADLQSKLQFLCNMNASPFPTYLLLTSGIAALGLVFCLISTICVIKYKSYDIMITAYCVIDVEIGHVNSF